MEKIEERTPGPWHLSHIENTAGSLKPNSEGSYFPILRICADEYVLCSTTEIPGERYACDRPNFEFIVKACNNFDALQEAATKGLNALLAYQPPTGKTSFVMREAIDAIQEALTLSKGSPR